MNNKYYYALITALLSGIVTAVIIFTVESRCLASGLTFFGTLTILFLMRYFFKQRKGSN